MQQNILEASNLVKSFGYTKALVNGSINIYKGKVMGLIGENGAGKSTIIKCITGMHKIDSGNILLEGKEIFFKSINESRKNGIAVVHQELQLVESLSVAENIFLGRLKNKWGFVDYKKLFLDAQKIINLLGVSIKPKEKVYKLTIAQQQMVEIAKALSLNAKIIILDEPTDALSNDETNTLFRIIKNLAKKGISFLYVTHRLKELPLITDDITIFKDGSFVKEIKTKNLKMNNLIEAMIGRNLKERFPKKEIKASFPKKFKYEFLSFTNDFVNNININLKKGEILGLAGLIGSGRSEFVKSIIGAISKTSGVVKKNGNLIKIKNIHDAIKKGIYYLSENRKLDGLDVNSSISDNIMISSYNRVINKYTRLINFKRVAKIIENIVKKTKIKMFSSSSLVNSLSGGNQQKVLFSKAMITNPDLLILDEPTRGIDVGERKEIYKIMRNITQNGSSIIMISSDLPEIIGMSDRVVVFFEGKLSGIVKKEDFSEEKIMKLATSLGGKHV